MMNNEGMFSLFEEIDKEIGVVAEVKTEVKTDAKKDAKKEVKTENKTKKPTPVPKEDPNIEIEKQCAEFNKIIVKYFTQEILTIEDEAEIKSLKLKEVQKTLVENGYVELDNDKIVWHILPSPEPTTGYLFVVGNFYAKG